MAMYPVLDIMYVIAYARIMTTLTASKARARFYGLLDEIGTAHSPILITGKRANGVLVSEDDWKSIQETLYLLSIPGMRKSIVRGMKTPVKKCLKRIKW